jgi:FlaA1/EpsC-like NDP-sugar epimerase
MNGGELFVRKIPSMKITDLALAMAPNLKLKEVGIRPGEKIHEMMISSEDSRSTIELDKYYIIKPESEELRDRILIKGKPVNLNFEYHSGNNLQWLTIQQMQNLINEINEEI